jgi:hypothetical protein
VKTVYDPDFADRYEANCTDATTRQGLDPMVARLTREGIEHQVEQTGGFTMVLTVTTRGGIVGVTFDPNAYDPQPNSWIVGYYPGETWLTGEIDYDTMAIFTGLSEDDAVAKIRFFQEM